MQRVLGSARRCWKVGGAPVDNKALSVPGGSSSFFLPIFMIPLTQLPHHTPAIPILPAPLSSEPVTGHTHLNSENSQHFCRKQGFRDSISHALIGTGVVIWLTQLRTVPPCVINADASQTAETVNNQGIRKDNKQRAKDGRKP